MSASPPKDADVEAEEPSAETTGDMSSREEGHVRGEGAFTEFDVKEQDRWLPIANGKSQVLLYHPPPSCRAEDR